MKKKSRSSKGTPIVKAHKKRQKRIFYARVRAALAIVLIVGTVIGVIQFNKSLERPLSVNAENYYQIKEENEINNDLLEETEDVDAVVNLDDVEIDKSLLKYNITQPRLKSTYPIDMIIRSEYAIVYDITADEVLYAKNADQKCFPASTTKILTSAVILDNVADDFKFTAGDELDMVNPGSSLAYVNKGSILDLPTMIDAIMLPSGNDASYVAAANVGRVIAGNDMITTEKAVQTFVDEMNRAAMYIGAENTHFTVPDGFHDDNHYTTVLDMLKITLYARQKPLLMESAGKTNKYAIFESGEEVSWENSNLLLHEYSDCYYMYANGLKTGMTDQSGYCVVATAERFEHDVVCIVFGAETSAIRWNDTIALLDAAFVQIRNKEGI
ncbi:MAG: D-alanyl-D-alanine carboxypeptidase [Oscillospiraceae bacterium]|nr:D-alanyl-D-alanine carboxypeptidase [Oscillospiraceae bacterium]